MKKLIAKYNRIYERVIGSTLFLLLLVMSFKAPMDPDMGWHLRNGLDTIANRMPQQGDIYSWTMAGYQWISHEWLTEIIMVAVNAVSGLWGLTILFTLIVAFTFWLGARVGTTSWFNTLFVALLGVLIARPIIGVRPQMLTLLGVAIILYLLFKYRAERNVRLLWWLPVVFLLWANVHAGFAAGFAVIGVFILAEFIRMIFISSSEKKPVDPTFSFKELFGLGMIGIIGGGVAALVNPYGWRLYQELYTTLGNTFVLDNIAEWLPIDFTSRGSYNLVLGLLLVVVLLIVSKFKVDYTKLTLVVVFLFVAVGSWRHLSLFAIVAMPFLAEQISQISTHIIKEVLKLKVAGIIIVGLVVIASWWHIQGVSKVMMDERAYANFVKLPYDAIEYLRSSSLSGNMFNEYNWGGYLIWKYPEQKVFIDGRMAIWETDEIKIFEDFRTTIGTSHRPTALGLLDKWDADFVFVYPHRTLNAILSLERDSWKQVYKDNYASIWKRVDTGIVKSDTLKL